MVLLSNNVHQTHPRFCAQVKFFLIGSSVWSLLWSLSHTKINNFFVIPKREDNAPLSPNKSKYYQVQKQIPVAYLLATKKFHIEENLSQANQPELRIFIFVGYHELSTQAPVLIRFIVVPVLVHIPATVNHGNSFQTCSRHINQTK